ncbi:MAG: thiamine phosphate synthase [Methanomassiliicoccaceae archaeon]|jgi:thiamine-phosphate pyrophosphorylase|nr:thiamine phosphate synthase [Methanomassiliicoccaceae archaeon]
MIIAVTDRKISRSEFLTQTELIASARPDMLILREKDLTEEEYGRLAAECSRICDRHNVKFCINSFVNVAAAMGSERVQVPFGLLAGTKGFRERWASVHSLNEAFEAERMGATHLIYGNVFETSCKPGAEGKGIAELKRVCDSVNIPVFAIGGISEDNIRAAMDAGCRGVCIRSLLMEAAGPRAVMDGLRKRMGAGAPFKI